MSREYFIGGLLGGGYVSVADDADRDYAVPQGYVSVKSSGPAAYHLVTAYAPGTSRNDFTGGVGVSFTLSSSKTFNRIGLRCAAGFTGLRDVGIWVFNASNPSGVASALAYAQVDMTGGVAGQFYYTDIAPITLNAGTLYVLQTPVVTGQAAWPDSGSVTVQDAQAGTVNASYSANAFTEFYYGAPAEMYFGVDLVSVAASVSTGTAALSAGAASVAGTGLYVVTVLGTGTLVAQNHTITSAGRAGNVSKGTGTLVAAPTVTSSRTNYALQSQALDDAYWTPNGVTISANSQVAPDSTTTAELLTDNAVNGVHSIYNTDVVIPAAFVTYTLSVYAKKGSLGWLRLDNTEVWCNYDLTNGVVGTYAGSVLGANCQNAGNGWYRCSVSFQCGTTCYVTIKLIQSNLLIDNASYIGSGQSVAAWGVQLEPATSTTAYIPTTTAPVSIVTYANQITGSGTVSAGIAPATGTGALSASISAVSGTGTVAAAAIADAWSAADKSANFTLSNADKTAVLSTSVIGGVRSTTQRLNGTAGKYYIEFKIDDFVSINNNLALNFGIMQFDGVIDDTVSPCYYISGTGQLFKSGSSPGGLGVSFADGDVVGLAWDASAKLIWFRKNNGVWNASGTANPATGSGGLSQNAGSNVNWAVWARMATAGDTVSIRSRVADLTFAGPAGFTSWMGEALPVVTSGTGALSSGIAAVAGAGLTLATGTGALTTTASVLTSAGTSRSSGAAVLTSSIAALVASGKVIATGTGALVSSSAVAATGATAPPAFRSVSSTSYASRTGLTNIAKPIGLVDGDIMIAGWFIGSAGAGAPTGLVPPSGWTQIGNQTVVNDASNFYGRFQMYWKRALAEPASYDFLHDVTQSTQIYIGAYSGSAASGMPLDVGVANISNTGSTATAQSITTTVPNTMLLYSGHNWDGSSLLPPTGMTERFDNVAYLADQAWPTAGATGTRSQTLTSSNPWVAVLLALKAAGAVGVSSSTGTGTLAANPGGLTAVGLSLTLGTAALVDTAASLTGVGGGITNIVGSGALTSVSTLAGAGVSQSSGPSSLLASTAATVAAVGVSQSSGAAVLDPAISHLAASGVVGSFGAATLVGSSSVLTSLGVARWTATGALAAPSASVVSIGSGQWVGLGTLTTGVATVAGAGLSASQSVSAALLASFANLVGFEGVTLISGTGGLVSQSSHASGSGLGLAVGSGDLTSKISSTVGDGISGSSGSATLSAQGAVVAAFGQSAATGSGTLPASVSALSGLGIVLAANAGIGALSASLATLSGTGSIQAATTGSGVLKTGTSSLTGAGLTGWIATGAVHAAASSLTGSGVARWIVTGTLNAAAVSLQGNGVARWAGSGPLLAQRATIAGDGLSSTSGTALLLCSRANVFGYEGVARISGSGNLIAQSRKVTGAGVSKTVGTGSLIETAHFLDGEAVSQSRGQGTLTSVRSTVAASGQSKIEGSGDLAAKPAIVHGLAFQRTIGRGDLQAQDHVSAGAGLSRSFGAAALKNVAHQIDGDGDVGSVGHGDLIAKPSKVSGVGKQGTQGAGDLVAGEARIFANDNVSGDGVIISASSALAGVGDVITRPEPVPDPLPPSYPGAMPWTRTATAVYGGGGQVWRNPGTKTWRKVA